MEVVLFYPISSSQNYSMSNFVFETGGFFFKKDGELFYNESEFKMELDSNHSVTRHVDHYKFKSQKGNVINVSPSSFNYSNSNFKDVVKSYMKESQNKMSEKESFEFSKKLDSLCKDYMIDYALASNNKELFLELTGRHEKTT